MSFEFKKAFEKATERRALTFNQQWAMSDIGIFSSEAPVTMSLYNVPPGKKFSIRQLQGTYGPFLIKSTHYDVFQRSLYYFIIKSTHYDVFKIIVNIIVALIS